MSLKYKEFKVYKDGKCLVTLVFRMTRKFPKEFYYMSDQVNRSCLSIVLNIAEGSAKRSDKDFNRFIENALGSATELSAGLEIIKEFNLVNEKEFTEVSRLLEEVIKQLGGLSKFLRTS